MQLIMLLMFVDSGAFAYKVITFDLDELNFINHWFAQDINIRR